MRIFYNPDKRVPFSTLAEGTVFNGYNDTVYLKICPIATAANGKMVIVNAVSLDTGHGYSIEDDAKVTPLDATITIE